MKKHIRIGTRKSDLSVAQTMIVVNAMKAVFPQTEVELVCRSTVGDRILDKPLVSFGGKAVFVAEFEEALLRGEIDFAVHSAKDLPLNLADELEIVGVLPRGDVRDVLICRNPDGWDGKPSIRIGTSSLRRKIQMEELAGRLWPEKTVVCENLRGNILTRLDKLEKGQYDGIILASAGLERLHILDDRKRYRFLWFSPEEMIPAGGQGILAIEGRKEDPINQIAEAVGDPEAMEQLYAERLVLKRLEAGCHEPVGVYCRQERGGLSISGIYERDGIRRKAQVWEPGTNQEDKQRGKTAAEAAAGRLANCLLGRTADQETERIERNENERNRMCLPGGSRTGR